MRTLLARLTLLTTRQPSGRALDRTPGRTRRRVQRGMTLLEIMIVLAILAIVMGLVVGPKVYKMFAKSKEDTTRIKVKQYAFEAFTPWSMAHPDKGCPDSLANLNEYMNGSSKSASNDDWGNPLKMMCGPSLPPGVKGIAVMSMGEDGKEGTPDDIKSWED